MDQAFHHPHPHTPKFFLVFDPTSKTFDRVEFKSNSDITTSSSENEACSLE